MEQRKILSQILSVRTEEQHENVSQVTRFRVGGLKVGISQIQSRSALHWARYSLNRLDHIHIRIYFELNVIKF